MRLHPWVKLLTTRFGNEELILFRLFERFFLTKIYLVLKNAERLAQIIITDIESLDDQGTEKEIDRTDVTNDDDDTFYNEIVV